MSRVRFIVPAGPGIRFAPNALDGMVGKTVVLRTSGTLPRDVRVIEVTVQPDGLTAQLHLEVLDA